MQTYWMHGVRDELISDTRSGLFITCDQCVLAKCRMNASLPYVIEASGVMWSCTQWECGGDSSVSVWFNQTILAWGYLISTSLLQNVRFLSTHAFSGRCSMRLWSGTCFNLINPKWTSSKQHWAWPFKVGEGTFLLMEPHLEIPHFVVVNSNIYSLQVQNSRILVDDDVFMLIRRLAHLLVDSIDFGYATPILQRGIGVKMAYMTAFVESISNYTNIKEPKCWVKTKWNRMQRRKSWVAYLYFEKKLYNVYKELKHLYYKPCKASNFQRSTWVVASNWN